MTQPPAYTIPVPVTARRPVPASIVIEKQPDGSGAAYASRRLDKRRMTMELHRRFGSRAGWPCARGRVWRVQINAPPPAQSEMPEAV